MRRSSTRLSLRTGTLLGALLALAACDRDPTGASLPAGGDIHRDVSASAVWNGNIRVGVVPAATSVVMGSAADFTITERGTGAVLLTGTNGTATVTLQSVIRSWYRLQVMCSGAAAVDARKAAAEAAGYPTFTEFVATANCTRLFIGRFDPPPASNFTPRTQFKNKLVAEGLAAADAFWAVKADPGVTLYRVVSGTRTADATSPVALTSSDGIVTIGGAKYRGTAEVRVNGAGSLAGINELPMEEYLYGVVPRELGPAAYPELEALKAQAVAARTYALAGLGKRASDGYDLLPTTSDQVYGGYSAEHPLSTRAVDETAGVAAVYGGKLITALYSSTSGGYTANNEDVFASAPVPYLRGVIDRPTGKHESVLDSLRKSPKATKLRGKGKKDFETDWARYHRWTFEWTAEEISDVISAYAGQPVGKVLAINVVERSNSGRVMQIEYVTEAGTFTDTKDHIRSSLRFIGADGAPSNLLSTLFVIDPVVEKKTGEVVGFEAYGGGFGHGVGMAQTGAVGMAEDGYTFEQILKHYYQGIDLTKWY